MHEPCGQGEKFGRIEATLIFFQDAERRREARELRAETLLETREEKVAQILETIASQGASHGSTLIAHADTITRIEKAHTETIARFDKAFTEAFLRLRKIEGSSMIARLFNGKRGPYIFAALVSLSVYGVVRMDAGTLDKLERIIKLLTGG